MEGPHEVGSRPFMPASTLSGRSVALLRVNLDDYTSEGRSISNGNYTRTNSLVLANQRRLYPLLFDCAAQSLLEFGRNRLHGDLGITAVLHTWGQKLDFHPHLHCIVTGGALSPDGKEWRSPKQRKFLFPVRALAALFRGKFLARLAQMLDAGELHLPDSELKIAANRARWFS